MATNVTEKPGPPIIGIEGLLYVPTLQDILYCRKTTKGVIETRIEIDRLVLDRFY